KNESDDPPSGDKKEKAQPGNQQPWPGKDVEAEHVERHEKECPREEEFKNQQDDFVGEGLSFLHSCVGAFEKQFLVGGEEDAVADRRRDREYPEEDPCARPVKSLDWPKKYRNIKDPRKKRSENESAQCHLELWHS